MTDVEDMEVMVSSFTLFWDPCGEGKKLPTRCVA